MINEEDWASLVAVAAGRGTGSAVRRLYPESGHDLYLAVRQPSRQRCLWYVFPASAIGDHHSPPALSSVEVSISPDSADDRLRCEMRLTNSALADVFTRLAVDVAGAVASAVTHVAGVRALFERLELWRRLLQSGTPGGLSPAECRGLYGELHVLGRLLDAGLTPRSVVSAWTGPLHGHQDFQFDRAAIEVKTTSAKQPQTIPIASERELDAAGVGQLFVVHNSLDERRGGQGETLTAAATRLRQAVAEDPQAVALLDQLLQTAGLLTQHSELYAEPHYSLRACRTFAVGDGFPRIVESDLQPGVGDVRYEIQLGALAPFESAWAGVITTIKAAQ